VARMSALERRGQLIEAGLRVIAREGMHGATVRAIVADLDTRVRALLVELVPDIELPASVLDQA